MNKKTQKTIWNSGNGFTIWSDPEKESHLTVVPFVIFTPEERERLKVKRKQQNEREE